MLKNYFTIAFKHLTRHTFYSVLHIICLVIGITFSMLIGFYVYDQESVNAQIKNLNSQYIIHSKWKDPREATGKTTLNPLSKTLREQFPELIANYYRFIELPCAVTASDKHFKEDISIGDTGFISMYGFTLEYGNPASPFRDNRSAVVTESFAKKFFGKTNVTGQVITIETPMGTRENFTITSILRVIPFNSVTHYNTDHLNNIFIPAASHALFSPYGNELDDWYNVFITNMIELKPGIPVTALSKPISRILQTHASDHIIQNLSIELIPLKDYYLQENNGMVKKMITTLTSIALFILLMAVINFVNIHVGSAAYRMKEIGLRKLFGGNRSQLIWQFLVESLTISVIAGIISLFSYEMFRPVFNSILNTTLTPVSRLNPAEIIILTAFIFLQGFIAGIYPAFILSASKIYKAVKGKIETGKDSLSVKKLLIVIQFTIAIGVFIAAINISRQVAYFFSKDLGYTKEQVMIISSLPKKSDSSGIINMEYAAHELARNAGIESVSRPPIFRMAALPLSEHWNRRELMAALSNAPSSPPMKISHLFIIFK